MRGGDQNPLDPKNSIVDMFPGLILRIFRPFGEAPSSIDAMSSPAFIIGEAVGRKLESSGSDNCCQGQVILKVLRREPMVTNFVPKDGFDFGFTIGAVAALR